MAPEAALKSAIEACGTAAELARRIGVTAQAINQWRVAPPLRVLEIERATEAKITRYQLRPDLYPLDETNDDRRERAS